jgi:hypothetical protein
MRWDDELVKLAGGSWKTEATDVSFWASLERGFVKKLWA